MRWKVEELLGRRTYQCLVSRFIKPVDLWTLRGVDDSLQYRCFSCICSPDNEDSELDIWESGEDPLFHATKVLYDDDGGQAKGAEYACDFAWPNLCIRMAP
jgi:hypothetical protein